MNDDYQAFQIENMVGIEGPPPTQEQLFRDMREKYLHLRSIGVHRAHMADPIREHATHMSGAYKLDWLSEGEYQWLYYRVVNDYLTIVD